jgi:hypothetical protein
MMWVIPIAFDTWVNGYTCAPRFDPSSLPVQHTHDDYSSQVSSFFTNFFHHCVASSGLPDSTGSKAPLCQVRPGVMLGGSFH